MKRMFFSEFFHKIHNTVESEIHCCDLKTVETVEKLFFSFIYNTLCKKKLIFSIYFLNNLMYTNW